MSNGFYKMLRNFASKIGGVVHNMLEVYQNGFLFFKHLYESH